MLATSRATARFCRGSSMRSGGAVGAARWGKRWCRSIASNKESARSAKKEFVRRCCQGSAIATKSSSNCVSFHWLSVNPLRSEEHTSELQSRVDISYAVFCLTKKKQTPQAIYLQGSCILHPAATQHRHY